MKNLRLALALAGVLLLSACVSPGDFMPSETVGQQVVALRADAMGLRKDAADYAASIQNLESKYRNLEAKLPGLQEEREQVAAHLASLKASQGGMSEADARSTDTLIEATRYRLDIRDSQADNVKIDLRKLQELIDAERDIRSALLWKAEQYEAEAAEMELRFR